MSLVNFKNQWGATGSGLDQQRSDLFYVQLLFPRILSDIAGASLWDKEVAFAVQEFPFPDRAQEVMGIKYLNQTNSVPGADTQSGAVDMTVRYAFNKRTAELLERWHWLISNPRTGGSGLGSAVKTTGYFYWLIPNMDVQKNVDAVTATNAYTLGARYLLEGVWIRNLKPSNGNMTTTNEGVTLNVSLQIDRYYPENVSDLNPTAYMSEISRGLSSVIAGINRSLTA